MVTNKLLNTICDSLGLSGRVRRVVIDLEVDEPSIVTVEIVLPFSEQTPTGIVATSVRNYRLVPLDQETLVADFQEGLDKL